MTTSSWSHVLAVVTMAGVIGCTQDRHATTNPEAASAIVAPDQRQPDAVGAEVVMRAVKQHYPNLAARSDHVPVLWFVADANNQLLATHRNDAVSPSGSFDEVRQQFPNIDLSHLADVRVLYGAINAQDADRIVVWARADANIVHTPSPMRATVANLVTHYYGTTPSMGHLRKLWFQASASGAILAHGEGINSTLAGGSGYSFTYAAGELLQDSVRAVWIGQ
jgi:hypothetical protein